MPSEPTKWINLTDFSPGIRDRIESPVKMPAGAADGAQTYDCVVSSTGALIPMPKLTATKTRDFTNILTPDDASVRISGFHVTGPMQDLTYTSDYVGDDNVELHFAYEAVAADNTHKWVWERIRRWATDTQEIVKSLTVTHNVSWTKAMQHYRATSFVDHRLHVSDPTQFGNIFVVAGWSPDDMDATENIWLIFPDPDSPTTLSNEAILTVAEPSMLVSHQGRVVTLDRHVFQHGPAGIWITNDQFIWTAVNLRGVVLNGSQVISAATFTQGPLSGYGAMGSSSAQELTVIKHRGGATTISGDLDNPTVYSLPGVVSTDGALTYGMYTPIGLVYAVRDGGIYAFGGGDSSEKLSRYLEDGFFQIKPSNWTDFYGKFTIVKDWVLTPNNYVYDTVSKSWWRISPTTPVFQWATSPQNSIFYGAPVSFVTGGPIMYTFKYNTKVSAYRWQSQFLAQTVDRRITVREVTVRAMRSTGAGETVVVTMYDEAGNSKVCETITLDNVGFAKLYRIKNLGFHGQGMKVRVDAVGNGSNPAPTVLEVNIGYDENNRQAAVA